MYPHARTERTVVSVAETTCSPSKASRQIDMALCSGVDAASSVAEVPSAAWQAPSPRTAEPASRTSQQLVSLMSSPLPLDAAGAHPVPTRKLSEFDPDRPARVRDGQGVKAARDAAPKSRTTRGWPWRHVASGLRRPGSLVRVRRHHSGAQALAEPAGERAVLGTRPQSRSRTTHPSQPPSRRKCCVPDQTLARQSKLPVTSSPGETTSG